MVIVSDNQGVHRPFYEFKIIVIPKNIDKSKFKPISRFRHCKQKNIPSDIKLEEKGSEKLGAGKTLAEYVDPRNEYVYDIC